MSLADFLFGRKLASHELVEQQIGPLVGVSVMGLDALSSAAYGPEALMTALIPIGVDSLRYVVPLNLAICALLLVVYFSYRQTLAAYPNGGGSYTVAKENLGRPLGLAAAAGLSIDYVLNVAVALSAGAGALVSAVPSLLPHTLILTLGMLALLLLVNLRGLRTSGHAFMLPTYVFLFCLFAAFGIGLVRILGAGGHPSPVVPPPRLGLPTTTITAWLLFRAFASGCTAMTGVEAVSNGVPSFRPPSGLHARRALSIIVASLLLLLVGVAWMCRVYGIGATPPGREGYESLLSQMLGAVAGRGPLYYVSMAAIIAVLALSANTSFAGFPQVWRLLAADHFVPESFARPGRRLVYTHGVCTLAALAGLLLVAFHGITDHLIPLFAVGAFLAFTLSQAGMVMHWWRRRSRSTWHSLVINACGAFSTGAALVVILASKFTEGAWLTFLLLPVAMLMFARAGRHHDRLARRIDLDRALKLGDVSRPLVIVPFQSWDRIAEKGLRLGYVLSGDVHAVHVVLDEDAAAKLRAIWNDFVEAPAREKGLSPPKLDFVPSPYREFYGPLFDYIERFRREHPDREIAVVLPELVERRWYHFLFGAPRLTVLKELLLWKEGPKVIVVSTPWYIDDAT